MALTRFRKAAREPGASVIDCTSASGRLLRASERQMSFSVLCGVGAEEKESGWVRLQTMADHSEPVFGVTGTGLGDSRLATTAAASWTLLAGMLWSGCTRALRLSEPFLFVL